MKSGSSYDKLLGIHRGSSLSPGEHLFWSANNPLVALCVLGQINPLSGEQALFKSMGFVSELLSPELKLVTTSRHGVLELKKYGKAVVLMKTPKPSYVEIVGEAIEDPDPETDIAFLVVRDRRRAPTKPFLLDNLDPPIIQTPKVLYSATGQDINLSDMLSPLLASQVIEKEHFLAYCKMSDTKTLFVSFEDELRQINLLTEGWKLCRAFPVVFRKGFSGSPIWDDDLRFYGMGFRGSKPEDPFHGKLGDIAICHSIAELSAARNRITENLSEMLKFSGLSVTLQS